MRVVIFTCHRDKEKAKLATLTVPADWSVAWVVDQADAKIDAPDDVEVLVRPFSRGRNLFGTDAVLGIADVLAEQAEQFGRVAKIDSDCLLVSPEFLTKGDLAGMAHKTTVGATYGLAYALSNKAACGALQSLLRGILLGCKPMAEDVSITSAANQGGIEDARLPIGAFWETQHNGLECPLGKVAIHCGCVKFADREGRMVELEMKRLGDELGIWRR